MRRMHTEKHQIFVHAFSRRSHITDRPISHPPSPLDKEHTEERMSYPTFQELLARVTDGFKLQDINMRQSIPAEEAVALSIRH
ncbi:hypothetical protein SK128_007280 [Halocaridina rubra]|uniref:Uncharacterized protein n=1 Tax=Halocaridina rubra TaxID=373956 RepID=A0AAN8ZNI3_HALRR